MENNLKYLVLGYRKYTGTRQRELAEELEVPIEIVTSLETGTYRHPTERLINKIKKLTAEFDQHDLIHIGRGYRIHDELGPDFKYFLRGLEKVRGINPNELKRLPTEECYRVIGSVNLDEFEVMKAGIQA
ncbi:MAG: hypothetical protein FJW63_10220 [Actinobacteria bacterium]|nr:hypothetical protein [Actinomycetota bacterium]